MGGSWARAFVVGGSEGIGLAVAQRLAARGTEVAVFGRSADKLRAARESLGATAYTGQLDVTDAAATTAVLDRAVDDLGTPDLVVTTAGFARAEWFHEAPLDNVRAMMETNYLGTVHVCHALVPHLVAAGRGTIVTTSSMAGVTGVFGYAGYSASKFAVVGFSEALRRELRPHGVHVATLCPPNTRTPGFDEENRTKPAEVLAAEEKVRTLEPEQVADHLLKVLPSQPRLVIPSLDGRLGHAVVRHLPRLAERMLRRGG
ncbi:SDR family oxidoreductase [Nocardioides sp.]|uniref:SDR family oxidoreductase n=1 Tax=Nocardioides sp. TaxID=35761 RepID=UPI001A1B8DF0|nr:SDR family oxidoreductase [Nocardioides sp.]MBJ7357211.1 SDR family oxidoreductase [Nocardioides sp.]